MGHVRQVLVAKDVGFKGVFAGQHLSTGGMQWFPPFQLLSFLAPYCEGMTMGTSVAIQPFVHPIIMAEAAATLDAITNGRSVLGLSAGWNRTEFESMGLSRQGGIERLKEGIGIIRRLWTESNVTTTGKYYQLNGITMALRPTAAEPPPIWIGASSEQTVRSLAGSSDALVYSAHLSISQLGKLQRSYLDERQRLGLSAPSDTPILRNVFVGNDRLSATEKCMPFIEASYRQYDNAGLSRDVVAREGSDATKASEDLDERLIIGSAREVAARLNKVTKQLKATRLIVRMQWYGMPSGLVEDSIKRFGDDVAPLLNFGENV